MHVALILVLATAGLIWTASGQDVGLELQRLSTKVDNLGDDFEEGIEDVEDEIDNVGNEIDDLEDEVEDVEDEMNDLKAEVQSLRSELQSGLAILQSSLVENLKDERRCPGSGGGGGGGGGGETNTELETLRTQIESNVETIQELRSQLATFQNSTLHILQDLKGQLTNTAHQLTNSVHQGSQERMEMKATITKAVSEFEASNDRTQEHQINTAEQFNNISSQVHDLTRYTMQLENICNCSCQAVELPSQVLPTLVRPLYSCGGTTGWRRAAFLNMSDSSQQCPDSWQLITSPKRTCGRKTTSVRSCDSIAFSTNNTAYDQVCGRAIGYQYHFTNSFAGYNLYPTTTLEGQYVDGLSVTHGLPGSREHIWTFAGGILDIINRFIHRCPCFGGPAAPPFIGNDYFCESGTATLSGGPFYSNDPLWDGQGCPAGNDCCSFSNPPWFTRQLDNSTTDDIEVRLCIYNPSGNNVPIELLELYIK